MLCSILLCRLLVFLVCSAVPMEVGILLRVCACRRGSQGLSSDNGGCSWGSWFRGGCSCWSAVVTPSNKAARRSKSFNSLSYCLHGTVCQLSGERLLPVVILAGLLLSCPLCGSACWLRRTVSARDLLLGLMAAGFDFRPPLPPGRFPAWSSGGLGPGRFPFAGSPAGTFGAARAPRCLAGTSACWRLLAGTWLPEGCGC